MIVPKLTVVGAKGAIANIYSARQDLVAEIRHATIKAGNDTRLLAFQLAPKDTWFMANHIRVEFTPQQRGFEVFLEPAEFFAAGHEYYPPFVEFGTSISAAQPFLLPAYTVMAPHYAADISKAIKRALRYRA